MVVVIKPEEHLSHTLLLEQSFQMRAKVVKHWQWKIPDADPYRDVDDYDKEDTVYFFDLDEKTNAIVGTVRLNPTTKPHLLSDVFAYLCKEPVPQSPYICEVTRYMTDTLDFPEWQNLRSRARLAWSLNQYALQNNIRQMTWLTTVPLYRKMINLWPTKPLGLPTYFPDDDNTYIAAISDFNPRASDILLARFKGSVGIDRAPKETLINV